MVFGSEKNPRKPRFFGNPDPLGSVELGGVEDGGVDAAGAPLCVGEGVGAEVEEEGHVSLLPLELERGGERQDWKWWWWFQLQG